MNNTFTTTKLVHNLLHVLPVLFTTLLQTMNSLFMMMTNYYTIHIDIKLMKSKLDYIMCGDTC